MVKDWLKNVDDSSQGKFGRREGELYEKKSSWHGGHSVWVCVRVCLCACVCVCYDVTLMWFRGWEAEMKQSVLDRNSWLADPVLRQKKKEQDRNSLEMRRPKRGSAWQKTNTSQKSERKAMRKERENLLCKHLLLYISRTNRGSVSGTFRLHSNLLNKADYDEKRGLLFHQIIPSPVNTFDCLQQFTGF